MHFWTILSLALLPLLISAATGVQYQGWNNGTYRFYQGDGSPSMGWPAMSEWLSFNAIFDLNKQAMLHSCSNIYANHSVPDTLSLEIPLIKLAIEISANETNIDPRFILAILIQESEGCVRAATTFALGDPTIFNPGLMQTHSGNHSCNSVAKNADITIQCPWEEIYGMVQDGAAGTDAGDGLAACLNEAVVRNATTAPYPKTEGQAYYMAARLYNSGSTDSGGDLGLALQSTACYCSDIANRLMGWTKADLKLPRECCLDTTCPVISNSTSTVKRAFEGPRREMRLVSGWLVPS